MMTAAALCLSSVVHYEARGESLAGKIAVASVVMNRVEHKRFPNRVCAVVKQRGQFSWVGKQPFTKAELKFAQNFLNGKYKRTVPKSYFFTSLRVRLNRKVTHIIGGHRFYGF